MVGYNSTPANCTTSSKAEGWRRAVTSQRSQVIGIVMQRQPLEVMDQGVIHHVDPRQQAMDHRPQQ